MAAQPTMTAKLVAEFLGTYALIFTIGCNVITGSGVWAGTSIACVLMVAIYGLGGISGANFNPAVTLALTVSKGMGGPGLKSSKTGRYMVVQIVGGLAAAISYNLLFGGYDAVRCDAAGGADPRYCGVVLQPQENFGIGSAIMVEVFYTFLLCFVVLNVAVAKNNSPNQFYGLAIGFVIIAGAYGAGAVSGGSFNPAVTIGLNGSNMKGLQRVDVIIGYTLAEFFGAALAAVMFKVVRPEDFGGEKTAVTDMVSEFLGTFILVLTVGLNVLGKSAAGAWSIAASLMSMIYALGNVSGAHFNPAVTVAIVASGRCPDLTIGKACGYIGAQLVGGSLAAIAYHTVYSMSMSAKEGTYMGHAGAPFSTLSLAPGKGYTLFQAMDAEVFFTFVLCFTVLTVAVAKVTNNSTMFGLAIGSCVTVGGNAIGAVSGGSLNPAVSVGIFVGTMASGGGSATAGNVAAYIGAEILGAVLAACLMKVTHAVEAPGADKDEESQSLTEDKATSKDDKTDYGATDNKDDKGAAASSSEKASAGKGGSAEAALPAKEGKDSGADTASGGAAKK